MYQDLESIEFTELLEHNTDALTVFSPNGKTFAIALQCQLQIWDSESKEIIQRFKCDNSISSLKWSPDSELIYCCLLKESIQIWCPNVPSWECKISEGNIAVHNVFWAPDSKHILVISEFYIKLTIFTLFSNAVTTEIDNLKPIERPLIFSFCEKYLVVAKRINFEDYLAVYNSVTWEEIKCFQVDTKDLAAFDFSPNDFIISILESVAECKILFYSIDGRLLAKYIAGNNFGFTALTWSPNGKFIAVGDYFGEVKIFSSSCYELVTSYQHTEMVEAKDIVIYRTVEKSSETQSPSLDRFSSPWEINEVVKSRPVILPLLPDGEKSKGKNLAKCGIHILQISSDGKFIASVNGMLPKVVFIYDVENLTICDIIIRSCNIKNLSWQSEEPFLLICTGSSVLDMWTPHFCIQYMSPFKGFTIHYAEWGAKKNCIILNSRKHSTILHLP